MDLHVCKERRNSNPESVMNCNNASGAGGLDQGPETASTSSQGSRRPLNLQICPTTGGLFQVDISADHTVQCLKKQVSKKLGVPQDRISLLHKERLLKDGTLVDNEITDGSRITLLPNVETGLMSSPPELSVMQALESLSEGQVNDFLTGRSPLTLAMRLGNHMMFLQLQLSTVSPSTKRARTGAVPSSARGRSHRPNSPLAISSSGSSYGAAAAAAAAGQHSGTKQFAADNSDICRSRLKLPTTLAPPMVMTPPPSPKSPSGSAPGAYCYPSSSSPSLLSSIASKQLLLDPSNTPPPSPCYGQKLVPDLPTIQVNDRIPGSMQEGDNPATATTTTTTGELSGHLRTCASKTAANRQLLAARRQGKNEHFMPFLDNGALSEAKRSLSMKLKEFSGHSAPENLPESSAPGGGAVIESMQKLGRGVYSGTFSGTLNSALQDNEGRPKRSVSTIVHILNDLLGATPPHPRVGPFGNSRSTSYCRNMDTSRINDSSRFDEEKEAIRGKVQHLQMMMEERRRRRQARRHHRAAPYPSPERPDLESSEAPPSGGMPDCAGGPTSYPPEASRQRLLQDMDLV